MTETNKEKQASVLVVEDDDAVRKILVRGLEKDGYTLHEHDGSSRIEFADLPKLDVCICDVGLPIENGYSISQRCQEVWPECETLLLSGHPPDELERRGVPRDAIVIQKPISISDVSKAIKQMLTMRAAPSPD